MRIERTSDTLAAEGYKPGVIVDGDDEGGMPNDDSFETTVKELIEDAVDYEESYLSLAREENLRYYHGLDPDRGNDTLDQKVLYDSYDEVDEDRDESNRSTYVSTDVRDTILAMLPSLVRIFTSDEHVIEFVPNHEGGQAAADQQRDYVNHVFFRDNNGLLLLYTLFKDALTVRYGVAKWWTDTDEKYREESFTGIDELQLRALLQEAEQDGAEVEVLEMEEVPMEGMPAPEELPPGVPPPPRMLDVTLRYTTTAALTKVIAVPPDEFRINRGAENVDDAQLVGHDRLERASELIRMGYDRELVEAHVSDYIVHSDDRFIRNPALTDEQRTRKGVRYGEWFIRVDADGDGIEELHKICTMGDTFKIVEDHIVDEVNLALFSTDPTPHSAIGQCMADLVRDLQRLKTYMTRCQLDNLAETVTPKAVINSLTVNTDDVLNDEVGAVIRTTGDPAAAVSFLKIPYYGRDVQESVNYLDEVRASRTGVTEASKGLDPTAMQSTTLSGVNAIISGAQERIEMVARILAETGMRQMFVGLAREVVNNPNPARTIRVHGRYVQIDPSIFDPNLAMEVNPYLGKGTDTARMHALMDIKATQQEIIAQFGINNPVVSPVEYLNTIEDLMRLANIRNIGRYFKPMSEEVLAQINSQPSEPSPEQLLAQAELEKVKKDMVIAMSKQEMEQAKLTLEQMRGREQDDMARDKINVDAALKVLEILSKERGDDVKAETSRVQAMNRPAPAAPGAPGGFGGTM